MVRIPLKVLLSMLAALLLLVLSAVIALSFFIDPNHFKPEIVAVVKEKTGRELELPGDIKLSFFPWLGITTGKAVLKNSQDFQDRPFITIEQSDVKVKLMPLFAKKIQVSHIVLKGLNVNLIKNKFGISNWNELTVPGKAKAKEASEDNKKQKAPAMPAWSLATLAIGGIVVERAHIDWDNQESGKHVELQELNLITDKFTFNQPVGIDLSFAVAKAGANLINSVKLASKLSVTDNLDHFQLTDFDLKLLQKEGAFHGQSLTATLIADEIAFDNAKQSIKMTGVKMNSGDLSIAAEISGDNMIDKPSIHGPFTIAPVNPARLMKQLSLSVPAMQDAKALSRLAINFNLMATVESVAIQNLLCQLDDTQIKGSASIRDFAQPAVNFNLSIDAIDADRYLSPKMKTDKPISSPAVALAAGVSKLPVATLRKLNANGELVLSKLKINGLTMQDIHLSLSGNKGIVTTKQSINRFYQGSYGGNLKLDLRNEEPALSVNEQIDRVRIEPLLKDYNGNARMFGVVKASAQLQGEGRNSKALKSSLNGRFNFVLKDGAIKGFNLQKIIDSGKALAAGSASNASGDTDQTVFSEIAGSANLIGGVVQNNDLVARSSEFRVDGKGSADLNTDRLDYRLVTKLIKKQATPTDPEQFHSTPVIIKIGGTFDKPKYTLDIATLLTDKNKAKIEKFLDKKKDKIDKLMEKLDKKLGPGASDLLKGIF